MVIVSWKKSICDCGSTDFGKVAEIRMVHRKFTFMQNIDAVEQI